MKYNTTKITSDIVRKARIKCGVTQQDFAKLLGRAQSEVSKYERGLVDPPGSIIIHCMHIIEGEQAELCAPSVDKIKESLKDWLNSPNHAMARSLIMGIILNEENKVQETDLVL